MIRILFIALVLAFSGGVAYSAPSITGVGGAVTHGQSITISGSGFGTKSTAAPLVWDDCETGTMASKWSDYQPTQAGATYNMQYRTIPYRSLPSPHSYSTKYMAGCHTPDYGWGYYDGRQVYLSHVFASPPTYTYASWYYRVDGSFPTSDNHKIYDISEASEPDGDGTGYYAEFTSGMNKTTGANFHTNTGVGCENCYGPDNAPNPYNGWIKIEVINKHNAADGYEKHYINNVEQCSLTNCNNTIEPVHIGIGTYFRTGSGTGDNNSFRFFDDVYVDNTTQRVMICNNATYASATVCENQVPSAWSNTSITTTVNQGALTGTNYLFVYDGTNVANATGTSVTFGADTTPPTVSSVAIGTNGTSWTFTYDETVTCASTANCCDDYTAAMTTAGAITLSYASGSGSTSVVCTGSPKVYSGDTIANGGIDYTTVANGIEDGAGNDLESFTNKAVTNSSTQDGVAPTLSTSVIAVNGTTLTLTFDKAVTQGASYNNTHWDVDCATAGQNIAVTYSSGNGGTAHAYTLASRVYDGDTCNIDFSGTANSMENGSGVDLAAIVSGAVTNNSSPGTPGTTNSVISGGGTSGGGTF